MDTRRLGKQQLAKQRLGQTDIFISVLGLGTSPMCKQGRPSKAQAIATIHRALDLGITFIKTADVYGIDETEEHYGEYLIHQALTTYDGDTSQVIVSTSGGCLRIQGKSASIENGNPDYLRQAIRASFVALGGEKPIDLWMYHRIDPNYRLEQSLKAVKEALSEGLIRSIGVCNVSVEQLKRACDLVPISAVENQYNLWHRRNEFNGVLDYCNQKEITFLSWSPLGGVGGARRTKALSDLPLLTELAEKHGVSVYCILLAWLRAKSPMILPIPGARRPSSIEDSVRAIGVSLTGEEVADMDALVPLSLFDRGVFAWIKRQIKQHMPV